MTFQIPEKLRYQGETVPLHSFPLASYFKHAKTESPFKFQSTAVSRGYVGTWSIVDSRLYLSSLRGLLKDRTTGKLSSVFPGKTRRVFADWYTGTLNVPQGGVLETALTVFGYSREQELVLDVVQGIVVGTHVQHNGPKGPTPSPFEGSVEDDLVAEPFDFDELSSFARKPKSG